MAPVIKGDKYLILCFIFLGLNLGFGEFVNLFPDVLDLQGWSYNPLFLAFQMLYVFFSFLSDNYLI